MNLRSKSIGQKLQILSFLIPKKSLIQTAFRSHLAGILPMTDLAKARVWLVLWGVLMTDYPVKKIREQIKFKAWKKIVTILHALPKEDRESIINAARILFTEFK